MFWFLSVFTVDIVNIVFSNFIYETAASQLINIAIAITANLMKSSSEVTLFLLTLIKSNVFAYSVGLFGGLICLFE